MPADGILNRLNNRKMHGPLKKLRFGLGNVYFAKVTLNEVKGGMEIEEKPLALTGELAAVPAAIAEKSLAILDVLPRSIDLPGDNKGGLSFAESFLAWLTKSASMETRKAYARDVGLFLRFAGIEADRLEQLTQVRPFNVATWRDHLRNRGLAPATIGRKITVLRSLFAYLLVHEQMRINPAHPHLVSTPPVPRDGKTVGLTPHDCRRLLNAPDAKTIVGVRDQALFAVLAYTGCRVGELCRMRVGDIKMTSGHRVVEIRGKGGKERRVPLNWEASKRIDTWLELAGLRDQHDSALFPPARTARGRGKDGFNRRHLSPRSVQFLVARYVRTLGLDSAVTVHSFRVTALTTARESGCDLIDIQTFAGHSDPKTTLSYIRNRDRLNKSPAYALAYGSTMANPESVAE